MDFLFGATLWSTTTALWGIAALALILVILWDWRLFLPGLALIQYAVGQVLIHRYGVPNQWLAVYFWVMVLAGVILALSPIQWLRQPQPDRSGNVVFRGLVLALLGVVVYTLQPEVPLPMLDAATARLFLWLVACAIFSLALTDSALFTGIGLLFWLIPLQSLMAVSLPLPSLIALIGILDVLIALVCSYLMMAESEVVVEAQRPPTDVTFPGAVQPRPALDLSALRGVLVQRMAALLTLLKRVGQ